MKKLLLPLLLVAPTFAATITSICTPNPSSFLGQTGQGIETCGAFPLPGGMEVLSITAEYVFDFQFDAFNGGLKEVFFTFDAPGTSADFSGTATLALRPFPSGVIQIDQSEWNLYINGFTVGDSFTGSSTAVTGATFTKRFTLEYTDIVSDVPEPATFGMVGIAMIAFALRRKS